MKWIAPLPAYLAVGLGLFQFHSAWGALLGFHFAIFLSLLIAKPDISVAVLFRNSNIKWVILSIFLCGSSGVTVYFLRDTFGLAGNLAVQMESLGLTSITWIPFIAYFALVNPFVEEYFWRGYLGHHTKSLHFSDVIYAGYHGIVLLGKVAPGVILFGLMVLVTAGWFWRQIAREDGGLLAPVIGHMAADCTILIALYWIVASP